MRVKERAWVIAALVGSLLALMAAGCAVSYEKITAEARPAFGRLAPIVPASIEAGIVIASGIGLYMAWHDMPATWRARCPRTCLTGAQIALNLLGEAYWFGRLAHVVVPLLGVWASGTCEYLVRRHLGVHAGTRIGRVRTARWLLSPVRTACLYRRMVLWECRSYPLALRREMARQLVVAALRDRYGRRWRTAAPAALVVRYRHGTLAPEDVPAAELATAERTGTPPDDASLPPVDGRTGRASGRGAGTRPRRRTRADEARTGTPRGHRSTDAELLALLADIPRRPDGTVSVHVARKSLGVGTDRARELLTTAGLARKSRAARLEVAA
jgi:Protein of unknown function (DUF2637)